MSTVLGQADEAALLAYFDERPDETIWLRVAHREGGARFTGLTADGRLRGVAAHDRNGLLHVHATEALTELVRAAVREGAPVLGVAGAEDQIAEAIRALGLEGRAIARTSRELIMGMDLGAIVVPEPLAKNEIVARRATAADLPVLIDWRRRYFDEVHQLAADDELLAEVERDHSEGRLWVCEAGGELVNTVAFSAVFPTIVQVEYSYSPPEVRAKRYGRSTLAGALLAARAEGVRRAVLNTDQKNLAVQVAVEPVGFRKVGPYHVVVFA